MANCPIKKEATEESSAKYRNCRMLNYHRYGDHPNIQKAIKALCADIGYKGFNREKQGKIVALDLYHCFKGDKSRYVGFYLSPNSYESIQKYNWFKLSYNVVNGLTKRLADKGYLELKKGFKDFTSGHTEFSKMKATPKLIEHLETHGVKPRMISTFKEEEVIILKGTERTVSGKKIKPKIEGVKYFV